LIQLFSLLLHLLEVLPARSTLPSAEASGARPTLTARTALTAAKSSGSGAALTHRRLVGLAELVHDLPDLVLLLIAQPNPIADLGATERHCALELERQFSVAVILLGAEDLLDLRLEVLHLAARPTLTASEATLSARSALTSTESALPGRSTLATAESARATRTAALSASAAGASEPTLPAAGSAGAALATAKPALSAGTSAFTAAATETAAAAGATLATAEAPTTAAAGHELLNLLDLLRGEPEFLLNVGAHEELRATGHHSAALAHTPAREAALRACRRRSTSARTSLCEGDSGQQSGHCEAQ